jgi:hypothetical protein
MNPINNPDERAILEKLDRLIRQDEAVECIELAIAAARRMLAADAGALLSWAAIPLTAYGTELPEMIQSSWVFILRSRSVSGAERHPNSHQRMVSYRGSGDFQVSFQTTSRVDDRPRWESNCLASEPGSRLDQRWVSIPPNTWHQAVTGQDDWVVVSFHTAPERELIEERPDSTDASITHVRTYLN